MSGRSMAAAAAAASATPLVLSSSASSHTSPAFAKATSSTADTITTSRSTTRSKTITSVTFIAHPSRNNSLQVSTRTFESSSLFASLSEPNIVYKNVNTSSTQQQPQQPQQPQQHLLPQISRKRFRSKTTFSSAKSAEKVTENEGYNAEEEKDDDETLFNDVTFATFSRSASPSSSREKAQEIERKQRANLLFEPWEEKGMQKRANEWLKANNLQAKLGCDLSTLTITEAINLLGMRKGYAFIFRVKAMKRLQKHASYSSPRLLSPSLSSAPCSHPSSSFSTSLLSFSAYSCHDLSSLPVDGVSSPPAAHQFLTSFFPSHLPSPVEEISPNSILAGPSHAAITTKQSQQYSLSSSLSGLNFTFLNRDIIKSRSSRFYSRYLQSNYHLLPFVYSHMDSVHSPRSNPYISSLQFDSQGCLLAAGSTTGIVAVHDFDFTLTSRVIHHAEQRLRALPDPVCVVETNGFCVECVKWHPSNDSILLVTSSQHNSIYLYDLSRGHGVLDTPTCSLSMIDTNKQMYTASKVTGIFDCDFRNGSKSVVVGGSRSGEICIWDLRDQFVGKRPAKLVGGGGTTSPIQSIQVDEDLVFSVKRNGDVEVWDIRQSAYELRKISLTSLYSHAYRQSQQQQQHQQLQSQEKKLFQTRTEGFQRGTNGLRLGLSSAHLCPNSSSTFCFQLMDGGVGYTNVATQAVSPVVCSFPSEEVADLSYRPRKFATKIYGPGDATMVYYGTLNSSVNCAELQPSRCVHDFGSACKGEHGGLSSREILACPTVLSSLETSVSTMSVACHPTNNYLVCGTDDNRLLVATSDSLSW